MKAESANGRSGLMTLISMEELTDKIQERIMEEVIWEEVEEWASHY